MPSWTPYDDDQRTPQSAYTKKHLCCITEPPAEVVVVAGVFVGVELLCARMCYTEEVQLLAIHIMEE
ncbi:hypothetical protein E2C01_049379 [Portunus trituberculatus]|uniref:Uncharacterized protein n=1 Tax=Portunus trituberculatus TaxID=210409 RepID=A0A5B7GFW8_PORTR|nr:hypothetical protein [Portunus trituberculatus]